MNTEFVKVIDPHTVEMRVWERGSGETMACGTGACATVVACVLNGKCEKDSEVTVKLKGGDLKISYRSDGRVFMTGGATKVFDGEGMFNMAHINKNYLKLPERYLFADVTRRANEFAKNHPDKKVLRSLVAMSRCPFPRWRWMP